MKIFISGINGFIGNALIRKILQETNWNVIGIDIEKDRVSSELFNSDRFEFYHGDIGVNAEWIELQIKRCDVVLPLAAVAVPKVYVDNPLKVFDLDFTESLKMVRLAVKYGKRLIFPSSSEVYGRCEDEEFDEINSPLVLGPTDKQRWIYSCSKQLLDRVIHAHGLQDGLQYTLFRPFNWTGPNLDRLSENNIGRSRVATEFISSIIYNRPIVLVDGGLQKRCFLYLDDGIDALMSILRNEGGVADGMIFNLGNPNNVISIRGLAEMLVEFYGEHPRSKDHPFTAGIEEVASEKYYGSGYQDMLKRKPLIKRAQTFLN